jgi:hypothetical protein
VGAVLVYNHWTSRKNEPRQADPLREPVGSDMEPVLDTEINRTPLRAKSPF